MIIMLLIKAVDYRILELCKAYNLSINGLANKAGMPPSTVASLLSEKSRNPTEDTILLIVLVHFLLYKLINIVPILIEILK